MAGRRLGRHPARAQGRYAPARGRLARRRRRAGAHLLLSGRQARLGRGAPLRGRAPETEEVDHVIPRVAVWPWPRCGGRHSVPQEAHALDGSHRPGPTTDYAARADSLAYLLSVYRRTAVSGSYQFNLEPRLCAREPPCKASRQFPTGCRYPPRKCPSCCGGLANIVSRFRGSVSR
jgi:hypothetical protein